MDTFDYSQFGLSEKEERILKSSIDVFSEKGFDRATTNEIAKKAGVGEGTIFKYFKNKKGIMQAIIIRMINLFSGKLVLSSVEKLFRKSEHRNHREILKELLYDRIKLMDTLFPVAKILAIEMFLHEDVRKAIYENIIKDGIELFKRFQNRLVRKGLIRSDLSPEAIFRSIIGNIGIFIVQRKLFPQTVQFSDMDKELDSIIDIICAGIEVRQ